jgi:hypothetical protein
MSESLNDSERRLAVPPIAESFSAEDLEGLPRGAQMMLGSAIEVGTPLAAAARLRMRGSIRLNNRWLPFHASQIVAPGLGFVWTARVGGLIKGYDRYVDNAGDMRWKLLGLFAVSSASGPDVTRSAAGREAGERFWLPTSLLPALGVEWSAADDTHPVARVRTASGPIDVHYEIDHAGQVQSVELSRWGDPDSTGTFGSHTFGGKMTEHQTFDGVTIPTRGAVGWHFRQPGWESGEFFRFRITEFHLVL